MCTFAASISRLVKPTAVRRSKVGAAMASGSIFRVSRRKSSPKVHLLKANLISNAVGSAASTFAIAERAQRLGDSAVDDLEVAAAGELLEFHQREIGLDAGGVAIHDKADGAGRRHHRYLRVAVAIDFTQF